MREVVVIKNHRINAGSPELSKTPLGGLDQASPNAEATTINGNRQPIDMATPTIPTRNDSANKLGTVHTAVVERENKRFRIATNQTRNSRSSINRSIRVLGGRLPEGKHRPNISGLSGTKNDLGHSRRLTTHAPRHQNKPIGVTGRG